MHVQKTKIIPKHVLNQFMIRKDEFWIAVAFETFLLTNQYIDDGRPNKRTQGKSAIQ